MHIFLLNWNCYLLQFLVLLFTLSISLWTLFSTLSTDFLVTMIICSTRKYSLDSTPWLIHFSMPFHLMVQFGMIRTIWKALLQYFPTDASLNHYSYSKLFTFVSSVSFSILISKFWCPYTRVSMISSNIK